ncbi:MAG: 3-hydroxyacyl-CoA dehydrogenase NAD-binding domain-containing protein [Chlamydiota bacterium]|nr:3-hydroxyacyl-CoA dehydrogenase NAD-binding domain-containing protein [Chlamydiota bacterium]
MTSALHLEVSNEGVATLTFDLPDEKINKLSLEVMNELEAMLLQLKTNTSITALLIKSAKPNIFIAGADLKGFEPAFKNPTLGEQLITRGHKVFNSLAALPFPTVAVIDGACLGGGTELALACDYRVVSDNEKTQISLPEVTLGIFPGWGGTQRLPRLVGIEQALNMILTGKTIDAKKAFKIKFADAILPKEFLDDQLSLFISKITTDSGKKSILKHRKLSGFHYTLMEKNPIGRSLLFHFAHKNVMKKTKGLYQDPLLALNLIKHTYDKKLEKGLQIEIDTFIKAIPKEFKNAINLINLFFANEELKKNPGIELNVEGAPIHRGAVIGAGTMGAGIAWLFSYRDIPVRLKDVSWECIGKGYAAARGIYKTLLKIRKIKPYQIDKKFQYISGTIDYSGFQTADIVIEAATENLELKHKIFAEIEDVIRPDAVIASNTSSLPISEMSKHMKHPERFLGMHFFNPPNRMPLVEIVAGEHTSQKAIATAVELCRKFKKTPLIVKDCAGFLVNRIFAMAANESSWMLQEGVDMQRLDRVITKFGMPMGPFILADEVGNDVASKVFGSFYGAYGERMHPPKLGQAMADAGLYGKKSGKGFYLYGGKRPVPNPEVQAILKSINSKKVTISDEEIIDRFTLGMINEAARCLQEGIVEGPMYVDMGLLYGIGFPPFRFGLLRYADSIGVKNIVEKLNRLSEKYGERFTPCDYIKQIDSFYGEVGKCETSKSEEKLAPIFS